jgi:hypothetical protein
MLQAEMNWSDQSPCVPAHQQGLLCTHGLLKAHHVFFFTGPDLPQPFILPCTSPNERQIQPAPNEIPILKPYSIGIVMLKPN